MLMQSSAGFIQFRVQVDARVARMLNRSLIDALSAGIENKIPEITKIPKSGQYSANARLERLFSG